MPENLYLNKKNSNNERSRVVLNQKCKNVSANTWLNMMMYLRAKERSEAAFNERSTAIFNQRCENVSKENDDDERSRTVFNQRYENVSKENDDDEKDFNINNNFINIILCFINDGIIVLIKDQINFIILIELLTKLILLIYVINLFPILIKLILIFVINLIKSSFLILYLEKCNQNIHMEIYKIYNTMYLFLVYIILHY